MCQEMFVPARGRGERRVETGARRLIHTVVRIPVPPVAHGSLNRCRKTAYATSVLTASRNWPPNRSVNPWSTLYFWPVVRFVVPLAETLFVVVPGVQASAPLPGLLAGFCSIDGL